MQMIKCLTVRQYWAWAIIEGIKRVENRTWTTGHRGPLAIHAGLVMDPDSRRVIESLGISIPGNIEGGLLLGSVDVIDVVSYSREECKVADDPFASGPYCWILENPRPLAKPIPMRGRQGLYNIDLDY